jgi:NADH dehydrogenase
MTVAVIGGGPTGVEIAGSIAELSRHTLPRDFRNIRPETTRIILIEAGQRLLPGFSADLADYARVRLERLGVEVAIGRKVDDIDEGTIRFADQSMPVGLIIWAAGVAASPLAAELGVELDRSGRVKVEPDLRVRSCPDVFAIGDVALCVDADGKPLPGLAQVAKQQGIHLGRALAARIERGTPLPAFAYRSRGNTAIVGRHAAVFEQHRLKLKGWFAWIAWALIHVYLLVGFQHRVQVSIQWLWRYLTYERGARLIADEVGPPDAKADGIRDREKSL